MFSSIRWKFIVVYFLLVFIAMVIVGIFIVDRLEQQQINSVVTSMEHKLESIVNYSSDLSMENWIENREAIQNSINEWGISGTETLYIILNEDIPTILATSLKQNDKIIGQSAFQQKLIDPVLVLRAFEGEKPHNKEVIDDIPLEHIAYPVFSSMGRVKGILYMTSDLKNVYTTVNESKTILTNATFLALIITVVLGFLIASSITEPIHDVTKKAEEMARGNFDQFVDVKSDDEIGQLANMFNYLTLKLKETIQDMDLERSKLNTMFNYMAEGVLAIDTNNLIIHANPIAIDILNLENNQQKYFDLKNINLENINYNNINTLQGDVISEIKSQVFKVKYAPFKNDRGTTGGLIVVFQNITKEHKLDNMRKEFVANVSHELKTPITTIKSYTETLMDEDIDLNIRQRFLNVIDSECDRMTRLVRDLLQLSNIDYKKTNWKKVEVSINDILLDIISKLDLVIKEKGHEVVLNIEDSLPSIFVDKDGIEQVILNIISNSIKYTENNGKLLISCLTNNRDIILSIKDNGIGIPEEDQKRIFERFYRVEKGRSRDLGGTGLGLAIAKEIIEAHNGSIELNSNSGIGTEVIIKLPVSVI